MIERRFSRGWRAAAGVVVMEGGFERGVLSFRVGDEGTTYARCLNGRVTGE